MQKYIREITLSQMLRAIKINAKILIIIAMVITILVVIAGIIVSQSHKDIYYTTGAIQINNYATNRLSDEQGALSDDKTPNIPPSYGLASKSEIEEALIRSGYILIPIIQKNHLDIKITPKGLPFIGKYLINICKSEDKHPSLISTYCKDLLGSLNFNQFEVPAKYLNKNFIIKINSYNTYELFFNHDRILMGTVGKTVVKDGIIINLQSISAIIGSKFTVSKLSQDKAINDLSDHISLDPVVVGKNYVPPVTGILKISLSGDNPKLQAKIVNDIIDQTKLTALEQQNKVLSSSIKFVEQQIIVVSKQLAASQSGMVTFQASNNVISLDAQERQYIQELSTIEQNILENKIAINQFGNLYANKHPLMIDLYAQRDFLAAKKAKLDAKLSNIPKNEAVYLNLKRNLDVYQQLYSFLLNKEQELKMKLSSLSSPVEILYYASSEVAPANNAISPLFIAGILLVTLALMLFIFLNLIFMSSKDPRLLSKLSNIPLLAIVPYKKGENSRSTELIVSYLQHIEEKQPIIINIGSVSAKIGKTFIISSVISNLLKLNKKCLYISFGTDNSCKTISEIMLKLNNYNLEENKKFFEIKINNLMPIDTHLIMELVSYFKNFDFVFMEPPAINDSVLFLDLAKFVNKNILILGSQDTKTTFEWLINDLNNLHITINQIIFNNPKKTLIKPLFFAETYYK